MSQFVKTNPKIPQRLRLYHLMHIDRLESILRDGYLYSDAHMMPRRGPWTTIGINEIKKRRLETIIENTSITVGQCVPFYFCSRSPMLYVLYQRNHPDLSYHGGQAPILHLVFNPIEVADWAESERLKFFITSETAACKHFNVSQNLDFINELNWEAIQAKQWDDVCSEKAAEFLVESRVSIACLTGIATYNEEYAEKVKVILKAASREDIPVKTVPDWYY